MRAAIVTNAEDPRLTESDALLVAPFAAKNVRANAVAWDDHSIKWSNFDLILLRSPYSYYKQLDSFKSWISSLETQKLPVFNSAKIVLSNCDKHYLRDLEESGINILPSVFVEQDEVATLHDVLNNKNWEEAVFKPTVSGGAYLTHRTRLSQAREDQHLFDQVKKHSAVLVQQFAPEICTSGEWSLIFIDGNFSHAINKLPSAGEFRTQPRLGATITSATPPAALLADSEALIESLPETPLYARVDSILRDERMALMELEMIEPWLFLEANERAASHMVDAIMQRIRA